MRVQAPIASPALKLMSVMAVAIGLQSVLSLPLAMVLLVWVLVGHRPRFTKLLRRLRLLILVLFVVTLFMTPGTALLPAWGLYPTQEGVTLALNQLMRLFGMLAAVTLLLDSTDQRALAAGSLALLQPIAGRAEWPERVVARLLLVFDYLESAPPPRNLQDVLVLAGMTAADGQVVGISDASTVLTLNDASLTCHDVVLGLGLLLTSLVVLVIGSV